MHRRSFMIAVFLAAATTPCSLFLNDACAGKTDAAATQRPPVSSRTVPVEKKQPADGVKFSCILFDGKKGNQTVLEGRIPRQQFVMWFKENYLVEGERIETPPDAAVIGVLVLTDGEEILVMPMHSWRIRTVTSFSCQSIAIGKAPMFSVVEDSKKQFIATMKSRLKELSNPTT